MIFTNIVKLNNNLKELSNEWNNEATTSNVAFKQHAVSKNFRYFVLVCTPFQPPILPHTYASAESGIRQ